MDFFQLFQLLVDMTDSSLADIARSIAYDRSYVSKWYNQKALPAQESWAEISDRLADYFANKMTREDFDRLAQANALVRSSYIHHGATVTLKSFLDDAYKLLRSQGAADIILPQGLSIMVEGAEETIHMLYQLIESNASMEEVDRQAYFTGDIFDALTSETIDALRFPYTSPTTYTFHYISDEASLSPTSQASIQKAHHYFRLAAQLPFIQFTPYVTALPKDFQICLEDTLAAYGTSHPSTRPDFKLFLTTDPHLGQGVQSQLVSFFQDKTPAIHQPTSLEDFYKSIEKSAAPEKPFLYIPTPSLFWARDDLRQSLHESGILDDQDNRLWQTLRSVLQEAVETALFIIPEEGLEAALNQGLVKVYKGYLQLEGQDKEAYVQDTLAFIEKKKAASECFIIPKTTPGYDRLPQSAIYSDGDLSFYNQPDLTGGFQTQVLFYLFRDEAFSQTVYLYLQKLANLEKEPFSL